MPNRYGVDTLYEEPTTGTLFPVTLFLFFDNSSLFVNLFFAYLGCFLAVRKNGGFIFLVPR
jgi:hypothetical protein